MTIRDARPDDVPTLAQIAAASYRGAFLPIIGESGLKHRDVPFFAERFSREWPTLRTATQEGRLVGFQQTREGRLDMLFLHPAAAGQGLGSALLADAEAAGARELECFRDNAAARRFYERRGWRLDHPLEREFAGETRAFVIYRKP